MAYIGPKKDDILKLAYNNDDALKNLILVRILNAEDYKVSCLLRFEYLDIRLKFYRK